MLRKGQQRPDTNFMESRTLFSHWRVQGYSAGVRPLTVSNSFVFANVSAKKCPRQRSAPPQREILDPGSCFTCDPKFLSHFHKTIQCANMELKMTCSTSECVEEK